MLLGHRKTADEFLDFTNSFLTVTKIFEQLYSQQKIKRNHFTLPQATWKQLISYDKFSVNAELGSDGSSHSDYNIFPSVFLLYILFYSNQMFYVSKLSKELLLIQKPGQTTQLLNAFRTKRSKQKMLE